jgi:hypothetical protein
MMKLRIKRRIRTADSEQWTLYDADTLDETGQAQTIGKIDLHYDTEMVYATLLIWSEVVSDLQEATIKKIVDDIIEEIIEPIGVAEDYSLDFFTPSINDYKFYTNYDDDFSDSDEDFDEGDDKIERNGNSRY